jgi:hypothetical protein
MERRWMITWIGTSELGLMTELPRACASSLLEFTYTDIRIVAEQILELFPLQEVAPLPAEDSDSEERSYRFKRVHENLVLQKPRPVQENEAGLVRPGELYRRYRTVEELPDNAKAFYELAGKPI